MSCWCMKTTVQAGGRSGGTSARNSMDINTCCYLEVKLESSDSNA
ncbi:hypothetical protein PEC301889_14580 [Pectobacterium carotovorum subsp. carotovorum]|nr:hypothetical protein PEC301889_14580 [Pectobacterium carotovorum subsp. carotovorum]